MRLIYRLYGKKRIGNIGLIKKHGDLKIGEGCIIMPEEKVGAVLEVLRKEGARVKTFDVYAIGVNNLMRIRAKILLSSLV
ncbi:MAG: hypothetical protein QW304_01100 [Thermoproteota archaeon]